MSDSSPIQQKHYRHNALCIGGEASLFGIAASFISASTVVPTLVARLTDSPFLIGLTVGLPTGAWLFPQLFIAAWVTRFRFRRPVVALACLASRPFYFVIGAAIGLFAVSNPLLALAILLIGQVCFNVGDAAASVPWFDLFAKTIPARRRGRVLGTSQIISGIGGVLVGIAVRYILADNGSLRYPWNYATLFFIAGTVVLIGTLLLALVREQPSDLGDSHSPNITQVLASLPALIRRDRAFAHLLLTRLVTGFISIATAFYVIYAIKGLGLNDSVTGLFLSAQVVGQLIAGFIMSALQDRHGVLLYMRVVIVLATLPPILALVTGALSSQLGPAVIYPYLLIFTVLGIYLNSVGWPFFSWILEHADEPQRPLYIGVSNTLGALTMAAPPLGGWLAGMLGYRSVFFAALGFAVLALILSLRLPQPRSAHQSVPAATPEQPLESSSL